MLATTDFIFSNKKNINPALLCHICKNPLKNPRALPCSCVYCYDCIVRVASRKHLVCPICKKKYSLKDLTAVNRPLQIILDQLHVQSSNYGSSKAEHIIEVCKQPLPATAKNVNDNSLMRENDNAADATQSVSSMAMIKQHPEPNEIVSNDDLNPFSNLQIPDSPRSTNTDDETAKTAVDEHDDKSTKVTTDNHAKSSTKGSRSRTTSWNSSVGDEPACHKCKKIRCYKARIPSYGYSGASFVVLPSRSCHCHCHKKD